MESKKTLRCSQTRRFSGRRGITPIRGKHKKPIPKTRGHKVEKKPYVPLRKHTSSQQHGKWQEKDTKEHCENSEREGDEICNLGDGRQNQEKCEVVVQSGNSENSEKSVHPGPVQTLSEMCKQPAYDKEGEETSIEAEELP